MNKDTLKLLLSIAQSIVFIILIIMGLIQAVTKEYDQATISLLFAIIIKLNLKDNE